MFTLHIHWGEGGPRAKKETVLVCSRSLCLSCAYALLLSAAHFI